MTDAIAPAERSPRRRGGGPAGPGRDAAFAGPDDIVVLADAKGVILYISESCRILGYLPHELVGRRGADFVHPKDLARFMSNTGRLHADGATEEPVNREFRYRRKNGSWAWLQGHPSILPSRDGRLGEILNVFCDISERRTMADALRAQARRLRSQGA